MVLQECSLINEHALFEAEKCFPIKTNDREATGKSNLEECCLERWSQTLSRADNYFPFDCLYNITQNK